MVTNNRKSLKHKIYYISVGVRRVELYSKTAYAGGLSVDHLSQTTNKYSRCAVSSHVMKVVENTLIHQLPFYTNDTDDK